ncbi:MAG: hypothetical protein U0X20_20905 [Caldilineaceae bacterium]
MRDAGVPLDDDEAVWEFARRKQEYYEFGDPPCQPTGAGATIFTTALSAVICAVLSHMKPILKSKAPTSGTWGYLHYPIMARQARTWRQATDWHDSAASIVRG